MPGVYPFFCKSPLLVLALAVGSSVHLSATVLLALRKVPATAPCGETLKFRLEAGGACAGSVARVEAWLGDTQVCTSEVILEGPGELEVALPIPVLPTPQTLVIQASCAGVKAVPQATQLMPPTSSSGRLKDEETKGEPRPPEKRARVEGSSAPSSAATEPASRTYFHGLPADLLTEMAEYAGANHFRYLSKKLDKVAQKATRRLVIQGNVTDAQLDQRLAKHARVQTLWFRTTPNLTADGIVLALERCPRLRNLSVPDAKLTFAHLQRIMAHHEHLVGLGVPEVMLSDVEVAALPPRMTDLSFRSLDVGDATLNRFQQLKSLVLRQSASFTGEHLPASVQVLVVRNCSAFTGRGLPASLRALEGFGCAACTGPVTAPGLRTLYLRKCPALTPAALLAVIRQAPQLAAATFENATREILQALPPGLLRLNLHAAAGLEERSLEHLTRLGNLTVLQADGFTGRYLPLSLRNLQVGLCPHFRSDSLWAVPLESLEVAQCRDFTTDGLPSTLAKLNLTNCPATTLPGLMANLPHLSNLRTLTFLGNGGPAQEPDPQAFQNHPALQWVDFARVFFPQPGQLWNTSGRPAGQVWRRGMPPFAAPVPNTPVSNIPAAPTP